MDETKKRAKELSKQVAGLGIPKAIVSPSPKKSLDFVNKLAGFTPKTRTESFVNKYVPIKEPEPETAEAIAEKLNTLEGAIDAKVIKDLPKPSVEYKDLKGAPKNAPLDFNDLRWHGGGLSTVATDSTLTGNGTSSSPLHVVAGGTGTVTSVSVTTANGISGTVATATTTPAITLNISGLDATKIADGSVTNTEFQYVGGVTSDIQTQLNAKGSGTVTAVSVATANGVSGSSSGGATPALTLALGAITPSSVNSVVVSGSSTPTLAVTGTTTASGTNTGDQNLFQTIAVSGQSNVVADSTTDTLTLVAGTNVTITTNASTDAVTINSIGVAPGAGGLTTQVQFNDSGALAGDSGFLYSKTTDTITLGLENSAGIINGATAVSANTKGGEIDINSGFGNGSGAGGLMSITSGDGGVTGAGGSISLDAGYGGATSGAGGAINITAGNAQGGNSDGGTITITPGSANGSGTSGSMIISGAFASPTGNAGGIFLNGQNGGGTGNTNGGNIVLAPGAKHASGTDGLVSIETAPNYYDAFLDSSPLLANRTFTFPNQSGIFSTTTSGSGAPGTTPAAVGQVYCDTSGGKVYISTGTTNSGDWKILN